MNGSTTQLSFERFAALCAAAVGALGVGYSIAFLVFLHDSSRGAAYANAILLLAGGLLATATFVAVPPSERANAVTLSSGPSLCG